MRKSLWNIVLLLVVLMGSGEVFLIDLSRHILKGVRVGRVIMHHRGTESAKKRKKFHASAAKQCPDGAHDMTVCN